MGGDSAPEMWCLVLEYLTMDQVQKNSNIEFLDFVYCLVFYTGNNVLETESVSITE
jgi:hypothetical protein